jgi:hypothetical protein
MKYKAATDVYYVHSAGTGKVSIIDINSSENSMIVIEGSFAGIFMEIVDQQKDPEVVLAAFDESDRVELKKMLSSLVAEKILVES